MRGYIEKIDILNPVNDEKINIVLEGKNLIFTGRNGSGKTRVLNRIHDIVFSNIDKKEEIENIKRQLKHYEEQAAQKDAHYEYNATKAKETKEKIKDMERNVVLIVDADNYRSKYKDGLDLFHMFKATRQSDITKPESIIPIAALRGRGANGVGKDFENYLSSLKVYQCIEQVENGGSQTKEKTSKWFDKITNDLRNLFEDQSLYIKFNSESLSYKIYQDGKKPYDFRGLSSGISAIMSIYTDLLMRITIKDIEPDDVRGVVIIDEIEAHLHVSIQKKIFRFFCDAFPNVQFILATHSPFILTSVNDAVIYDLSRNEKVDDLSSYSYEAVVEGLFDVLPVSHLLEAKIREIATIVDKENLEPFEVDRLKVLIDDLTLHKEKMGEESLFYFGKGEIRLLQESNKSV